MVHYTCDMCGRPLLADEDIRYVVKIEVYTACDAMEMADDDEDLDEEIWEREEESERPDGASNPAEPLEDGEYKTFRFDLCTKCHKKYLQDPLFLKSWNRTRFSEN
ncbi:MAG: hypothetical protein DYG83_03135 [Candidatus Brocadia sp. AMX2]|uniref:Uncharacterized protein n=1 Tax=Candidatus Brocadia sinica JPN1 TaxID=1197129 RepID=A0ABQ0JWE8_9BACT|nr:MULTISPECIES: hypothetical protein [Brocadia]KXK29590.1 MAG: hypothetical protein UZ01_01965 [Candidatus Brocadia sinica]MBC6931145.1 hypothetical protein [Candidatus Brocadia sp.]MBL1167456.1 hypothetical protein [Candidatus Brocadia sp. AMX1]NOG41071.1 hypothetical protein [Planctomycetota bacterium]KAA0244674.1 MAG: hypothetical protein EDM70_05605 [Candidatus Brocadia sp. AMX2]